MKLKFERAYILKNDKKIKIFDINILTTYFNLSFKDNFYIRDDLKNRIFFSLIEDELILTDSLKNFVKYMRLINFDKDVVNSYKKIGFIPSPYTVYKNVFCIPFYSGIKIFDKLFEIKKFFPNKTIPFKDQDEFEKYMGSLINKDLETEKLLLFSGGSDSLFIFYNLLQKKILLKNIIVKMKGFENDFYKAKKISDFYNIKTKTFENFYSKIEKNIHEFIKDQYEPIEDPIVPIYLELINNNQLTGNEIFYDGQGSDSLLMGLPHNLLVNLHVNFLNKVFLILNKLFIFKLKPDTGLKRFYYRVEKISRALAKDNWISCFLSSIEIEKNDKFFNEFSSDLNFYYNHYGCKHKAIAFFFIISILDAREMQKYRALNKRTKIILPFLDKKLIEKVFSTHSKFFIGFIYKKKPIYNFVNKFNFKISNLKTSPFFVDYSIKNKKHNIYEYSLQKLNELLKN